VPEALSGPTTPNLVLELFFIVVVTPLLTVKGPLVPVVPVESIAETDVAPRTDSAMVMTIVLKVVLKFG
jgi:hypothetical protein